MERERLIKKLYGIAVEIKQQYVEDEDCDWNALREFEKLATENEIAVYFDENGIPEQIEDERIYWEV